MEVLLMSIVGWVITIGIAIYTARSGAKDTAKKIAALEDSTTKQVESVKDLTRMQLQMSRIQLEKELTSARYQYALTASEVDNAKDSYHSMVGVPMNEFTIMERNRREKEKNLSSKEDYFSKQISLIKNSLQKLEAIGKEINEK